MLADAFNMTAINKIYKIKEREKDKPLLILIKDQKYCNFFSKMKLPEKILKHVPGEVTFIMPLDQLLTKELKYLKDTVALRIPDNNFINDILSKTPPIVAPSANPTDYGVILDGDEIVKMYENKVDLIINAGMLQEKKASTLFSCIEDKVLRQGSIVIE
jgi:L-threonylcarbamoyladenylate synthase